jgi:predicted dehydrogenase
VRYALLGAAGYVTRKHVDAMAWSANKGELVVATDPHDSVGYLDGIFPDARFTTGYHEFWNICKGEGVDYVVVASPNYKHFEHAATAMLEGFNVIVEKPVVLWPEEVDELIRIRNERNVECVPVLQMRFSNDVLQLKAVIRTYESPTYKVEGDLWRAELTYETYRGDWFWNSWKGAPKLSGGLAVNIGIHLFDLLGFWFGQQNDDDTIVTCADSHFPASWLEGQLVFDKAIVDWKLDTRTKGKFQRKIRIHCGAMGRDMWHECSFTDAVHLHKVFYNVIEHREDHSLPLPTLEDSRDSLALATEISIMAGDLKRPSGDWMPGDKPDANV